MRFEAAGVAFAIVSLVFFASSASAATTGPASTSAASPIAALQDAASALVAGAEHIVASIEAAIGGVATVLHNNVASVAPVGTSLSYTAAADISQSPAQEPTATVADQSPSDPALPPDVEAANQPVVDLAPSANGTVAAGELSNLLTEFARLLTLLPSAASSGVQTPSNDLANPDLATTQQEIAALQREVAQTNQINTLSNVTLISPNVVDGSLGGEGSSGGSGSFDSLSVSGASSLAGVAASSLSVAGTSTLAGINLISTNCSTYGNGGKLTTDAFGNVICSADQGGSGSTVGGADTQVQFNSGGSFAGSASFTFASSTGKLTIPNASTTNLSVSGSSILGSATSTSLFSTIAEFTNGIIGTLNASVANIVGFTATNATTSNLAITGLPSALLATNGSGSVVATTSIGVNYLTGVLGLGNGGTGIGATPGYGQLLVGNASGGYTLTSTSSLDIASGGGTWGSIAGTLSNQTDLQNALNAKLSLASWYATTTDGLVQGATNKYFSNALAQGAISVSGLPLTYSGGVVGINQASGSQPGFLASSDWTAFNAKVSSTSLSATYPLSYNSGTGVFSIGFGTTTNNTFSGANAFNGNVTLTQATTTDFAITGLASSLIAVNANGSVIATTSIGTNLLSGVLATGNGGTGIGSYATGDILYADSANHLTTLHAGGNGTVLEITGGVPAWGASAGGSGGGTFSTTTSQVAGELVNYSNNPSDILAIGGSATTSAKYFFDPNAQFASLAGAVSIGGTLSAGTTTINSLSATNTGTSTFAGGLSVLNLNQTGNSTSTFAKGINIAGGCFSINGACLSTPSSLLASANTWATLQTFTSGFVSNSSSTEVGNFTITGNGIFGGTLNVTGNTTLANATSTSLFSTTASSTNLSAQTATLGSLALGSATTTSGNGFNILTGCFSVNGTCLSAGSSLLGTTNTWAQLQTFSNGFISNASSTFSSQTNLASASSTVFSVSGEGFFGTASTTNLTVGSAPSGFLRTNAFGAVSATSTFSLVNNVFGILGIGLGGTGTSTAPTYGQLLIGNASGGYTLTSTSSLGIASGSGIWGSITGTLSSQTDLQSALNLKLSSSSLATSALLAGLVSDHIGSGSLVFATSPTFAGTPVFGGGLINDSVNSTTTVPNGAPYAWTVATSSSANPLIEVDTSGSQGSVSIGAASSTGSSVVLGATGEPANLVFAASSTIEGAGTGQAITIGANSDILDFGVNVGIGTTSPGSLLSLGSLANLTTATSTFYSTGGINLTKGCFSINGTCISGSGGSSYTFSYPLLNSTGVISEAWGTTTANTWSTLQTFTSGLFSLASSTIGNGTQSSGLTVSGGATTTGNEYVAGTGKFGSTLALGTVTNCTGSEGLQTDSNGNISCGTIASGGASSAGGWTTNNVGLVSLSTTTNLVAVGATSTPYAKFTILSGANATTTLALVANSGQTADILDVYGSGGGLSSVFTAGGSLGLGTTSPGSLLSLGNLANFTTATSTFYSTGGINIESGCFSVNGTCIGGSGGSNYWTSSGGNIYSNTGTDVGVGTTTPGSPLSVAGNGYFAGSLNLEADQSFQIGGITVLAATSTYFNTLGGFFAGANLISTSTASLTSAQRDTAFGYKALQNATSTSDNVGFGYLALQGSASTFTGNQNVAIGNLALASTTAATQEVAIGYQALQTQNAATGDIGIGYQALKNLQVGSLFGGDNTAIGWQAGAGFSGSYGANGNVFVGYQSGYGDTGVGGGGNYNTLLGYGGSSLTSGTGDILIGAEGTDGLSSSNVTSGGNDVLIGYNIDMPGNGSISNALDIQNILFGTNNATTTHKLSQGQIGIGTTTPWGRFVISANSGDANTNIFLISSSTPSATTTLLVVNNSGNVGIGTSSPQARLEVWGSDTASTSAFTVANSASTTEFTVYDTGNATLAGSLVQNSDERLKTNIENLNGSSSLAEIDALNPVTFNWIDPAKSSVPQFGFIAQQVLQVFPNLVSTTSPTALTPGGTLSLNYIDLISPIVSAIQALDQELASLASTVADFTESFTSRQITATNELCIGQTCIDESQLQELLASAKQSQGGSGSSSSGSTPVAGAADTPPVISINGDNPAVIQVGATYTDLGVTITGPQADLNLGIQTYVNGTLMNPVQIDTSEAATDTIDYVVTDSSDNTSTSTRTVIIQAPAAPAPDSDAIVSTTPATASSTTQ